MSFRSFVLGGYLALGLVPVGVSGQSPGETTPGNSEALTLFEAVSLALQYHPALGEAMAQKEVAAGISTQNRAAWYPSLSLQASVARYQEPSLVAPLHGFEPDMPPEFDRNLSRGNLTLSYSLFDGGARRARIGQAESGEAVAMAGESLMRMEITASVAAAYLDLLTTVELLAASEAELDGLRSEEERVRNFLSEGKAPRVDLLRIEAALSQAESRNISLRSTLDVAWGRLARLTGLPAEEIRSRPLTRATLKNPATGSSAESSSVAMEKATGSSPELAVARQRLSGAAAGVREAKASRLPQLLASGSYAEYGDLDGGYTFEWQGALQLSYALFTGGARKGKLDRAKAEERKASETLRRTEMIVEEGVDEALAAVVAARAIRGALEKGLAQAEEVARIEALALEVGSGAQTDFLRAQAELFQARAALAQAKHGEVLAGIRLVRITGDLDLDWLRENMEVER